MTDPEYYQAFRQQPWRFLWWVDNWFHGSRWNRTWPAKVLCDYLDDRFKRFWA